MINLEGKTALVTGSTKGIGAAIVRSMHEAGATVIGHYGHDQQSADALIEQYPNRLKLLKQDLAYPEGPNQLWADTLELVDRVDILINNAGIYVSSPTEPTEAWSEGWHTNLQVNLRAPADLCRHAINHFIQNNGGIIINMASRSSHRGDGPQHLAYGAAKGGLLALTKGIARGYGHAGVLAYAVAPGWVRTAMAEEHIATVGEDRVTESLPLREVTPPADVAAMVTFLASGLSRHATGATIDITGADYVR